MGKFILRMLPCMYRRDVEPLAPVGLKGAWQPQRSGKLVHTCA
jgi:hypothetical protein